MWILRWGAVHVWKELYETWNLQRPKNSSAYLSKRCVEVHNVDFRLQVGGFE